MEKRFQSVEKKDLGLIRSEAVLDGIVQYDYRCYSVLHAAAVAGWVAGVRYIIDHGILEVDVVCPDDFNQTPLFLASDYGHAEVVRFLLSAGVDPNIANEKTGGLSTSFFHRVRISVRSLSMGDALEDKFAALVQCSSVTCRTTDTIDGVAASNVSENPDGRLATSSQLADESWAPVAQGHLGGPSSVDQCS